MKTTGLPAFLALFVLFAVGVPPAAATLEVTASVAIHGKADFYEPLARHGVWVEVGSYGRCWRPAHVAVGWRPYCQGYWVWTDCGWYWASDEPWAWACYHYGAWIIDPVYGWIWVPGIEWAPAWVIWRYGGGYCGWAPFPAHGVVVAPAWFVFVETRHFQDRVQPGTVLVNNSAIIGKTTLVKNISRESRTIASAAPQPVMVNNGPGVEPIQKATGKAIRTVPIIEASRRTPVPDGLVRKPEPRPAESAPGKSKQPGASGDPPASREQPAQPETKPAPPNRDTPPSREEVTPAPAKPRSPAPSPGRPHKPSKSKDKDSVE